MLAQLFAKIINNSQVNSLPQVAVNDGRITTIFNVVLAAAGAVAVVMIIVSGIQFTVSQGDPAKVKSARDGILYSVIGLIVVMFSFVILNFVIGKF